MTDFHSAGERLCGRELRKERRVGVMHFVTGQHAAERVDEPIAAVDGYEMSAELTYVDVMGHAVLAMCALAHGTWRPVVVVRAGQVHTFTPCLASKAGFELSETMIETLRGVE